MTARPAASPPPPEDLEEMVTISRRQYEALMRYDEGRAAEYAIRSGGDRVVSLDTIGAETSRLRLLFPDLKPTPMTPAPPPPDPSDPGITSSNPDGTASWRPTPPPRIAAERGPRTASGRALLDNPTWMGSWTEDGHQRVPLHSAILAIEAEATAAVPLDAGTLERACVAVVGPWFDESHETGRFAPMVLAQRILREHARLVAARAALPAEGTE